MEISDWLRAIDEQADIGGKLRILSNWTAQSNRKFSNPLTQTLVLAEVPNMIANSNTISSSAQQQTSAVTSPVQPASVTLNMAEALTQAPPKARATPELSVKTQRLEELAIKQSRQLIPVTPSIAKGSSLCLFDKVNPKTVVRSNEMNLTPKIVQQKHSSPPPVNANNQFVDGGVLMTNPPNTKLLVLKPVSCTVGWQDIILSLEFVKFHQPVYYPFDPGISDKFDRLMENDQDRLGYESEYVVNFMQVEEKDILAGTCKNHNSFGREWKEFEISRMVRETKLAYTKDMLENQIVCLSIQQFVSGEVPYVRKLFDRMTVKTWILRGGENIWDPGINISMKHVSQLEDDVTKVSLMEGMVLIRNWDPGLCPCYLDVYGTAGIITQMELVLGGNLSPGFDPSTCRSVYVSYGYTEVMAEKLKQMRIIGSIVKRLKDADSGFKEAYQSTISSLAGKYLRNESDSDVFGLFVKPLFETMAQNEVMQAGAALCMVMFLWKLLLMAKWLCSLD